MENRFHRKMERPAPFEQMLAHARDIFIGKPQSRQSAALFEGGRGVREVPGPTSCQKYFGIFFHCFKAKACPKKVDNLRVVF